MVYWLMFIPNLIKALIDLYRIYKDNSKSKDCKK